MVGLVLAIAGAATGGGLTTDDYHEASGGSAHKALGGLTVAAAAIQVRFTPLCVTPLCQLSQADVTVLSMRF